MQPEEKQSGPEISPQSEVMDLPKEVISEHEKTGYALLDSEEYRRKPDTPDLTVQPADDLGENVQINLRPPIYSALNGSGRIVLQMERAGAIKDTKSGLFMPGGNIADIGKSVREIGPIPSDAMFFVVDYDRTININFRTQLLKTLGLHDVSHLHIKDKNKQNKAEIENDQLVRKMDQNGELDIIRIGDRVFFNHINFIPVKIVVGFQENYIAHHYDILGVLKSFPRNRLEVPQPALELVK